MWLVAKRYSQKEGIDFSEIFSPIIKHTSIRMLLSIIAAQNLKLKQMNVKRAFFHRHLKESIYIEQLLGFREPGPEGKVGYHLRSEPGQQIHGAAWQGAPTSTDGDLQRSCLQPIMALSTTEVEYIGITEAVKEALWLKGLVLEMGLTQGAIRVHCDSQNPFTPNEYNTL
ncbi:uncharacterized protein [Elaeis guineensis]|uniref:uncharacterized protein n=1 Tax=Elaeis guineensis var. tenera TaxID=51953 RepID=UPI003C6CECC3